MNSKPSPPSLRDIANLAGVSVNTVSRALTGKPDVNAETRTRVQALAKELGYTPNLLARSLLRGRSSLIGFVVTDCTNPFYAGLIRAAETALSRKGYAILLGTSNEDPRKEERALTVLQEHRVDGILLTAVDVEAEHVCRLLAAPTPTVLLGRRAPGYEGAFVGTDNVAGAERIVRYLMDQGHRRIAHVARADRATSGGERLMGYRNALAQAGIVADELIFPALPTLAGGEAACEWLLQLTQAPTAVFAYNDSQAIGLLQGLQRRGKRIPADYSVAGFDDIEISHLISPQLTTVAQPVDEIGARGASILIDLIAGIPSPPPALLQPELVVRQSIGRSRSLEPSIAAAVSPRRRATSIARKGETHGT